LTVAGADERAQLLVIAGPTASGKTSVAIELARALDAEIIGADSMQVYRYLDIGTDKPTADVLGDVVHHMIDLVDPDEDYDAARFVADADAVIADVGRRGRRAIVAGGTGLYLRALLHGLQGAPGPDPEVRAEIGRRAEEEGWPALHRELARVDPETADRLHENDGVRILRALEVYRQTGEPISSWQRRHRFAEDRYRARVIAIERTREELHRRIDRRIDLMMEQGFLDEVRDLIARGYGPELKPMQGLGYRRLCQHVAGELTLAEATEKIRSDTKRLARRQRTWFRDDPEPVRVEPDVGGILERARRFLGSEERAR
jgi:tRNA dimethylallyltransferase